MTGTAITTHSLSDWCHAVDYMAKHVSYQLQVLLSKMLDMQDKYTVRLLASLGDGRRYSFGSCEAHCLLSFDLCFPVSAMN